MNFELTAEFARIKGVPVETVVVADDVALHQTVPDERRRGMAGAMLIHKIVDAV